MTCVFSEPFPANQHDAIDRNGFQRDLAHSEPYSVGGLRNVNTLYRTFGMTSFQLVERFGREAVSTPVRERYDRGQWDHEVEVVHAIEPNEEVQESGGFARPRHHMPSPVESQKCNPP